MTALTPEDVQEIERRLERLREHTADSVNVQVKWSACAHPGLSYNDVESRVAGWTAKPGRDQNFFEGATIDNVLSQMERAHGVPAEAPAMTIHNCYYCGESAPRLGKGDDLRPYGPGGTDVHFSCATATPEREQSAREQFHALMDKAAIDGDGFVALTPNGPRPAPQEEKAAVRMRPTP